jgi:hypothetical protein
LRVENSDNLIAHAAGHIRKDGLCSALLNDPLSWICG